MDNTYLFCKQKLAEFTFWISHRYSLYCYIGYRCIRCYSLFVRNATMRIGTMVNVNSKVVNCLLNRRYWAMARRDARRSTTLFIELDYNNSYQDNILTS